ncbi:MULTISPECIES: glycosyltransferase [unclassified Chryseobacterium]|uniref:glycosyltransferase n=1 Tax=unclassified Chryseobacterium TaxID=2593645 RepID=UPI000D3B5480|nr:MULTISPECIES: glycosyltransferase [unclassified Chryseobacterium]PTT76548.1 hypothetical protein DBR25_05545 [Chryseobacterium sp. HMWF001]PVV55567.1 hypothetical protein DD829_13940 [Chryseobacterium sp. HMWF035]
MKILFFPGPSIINAYYKVLLEYCKAHGIETARSDSMSLISILRKGWSADLVHINWISKAEKNYWNLMIFSLSLVIFRAMGKKIVWTIHNYAPHENTHKVRSPMLRFILMVISTTLYTHYDELSKKLIAEFPFIDGKIQTLFHPTFETVHPRTSDTSEAKSGLGITDHKINILFFGYIRKYKGLSELLDLFKRTDNSHLRLMVVGSVDFYWENPDEKYNLLKRIVQYPDIFTHLEFVEDDQVQLYALSADVFIVPYLHYDTSGVIMLAVTFGKTVIARRSPFTDSFHGNPFILYDNETELEKILTNITHKTIFQKEKVIQKLQSCYSSARFYQLLHLIYTL